VNNETRDFMGSAIALILVLFAIAVVFG